MPGFGERRKTEKEGNRIKGISINFKIMQNRVQNLVLPSINWFTLSELLSLSQFWVSCLQESIGLFP